MATPLDEEEEKGSGDPQKAAQQWSERKDKPVPLDQMGPSGSNITEESKFTRDTSTPQWEGGDYTQVDEDAWVQMELRKALAEYESRLRDKLTMAGKTGEELESAVAQDVRALKTTTDALDDSIALKTVNQRNTDLQMESGEWSRTAPAPAPAPAAVEPDTKRPVKDPADLLSPEDRKAAEEAMKELRENRKVVIEDSVVGPPEGSIDNRPVAREEDRVEQLFRQAMERRGVPKDEIDRALAPESPQEAALLNQPSVVQDKGLLVNEKLGLDIDRVALAKTDQQVLAEFLRNGEREDLATSKGNGQNQERPLQRIENDAIVAQPPQPGNPLGLVQDALDAVKAAMKGLPPETLTTMVNNLTGVNNLSTGAPSATAMGAATGKEGNQR